MSMYVYRARGRSNVDEASRYIVVADTAIRSLNRTSSGESIGRTNGVVKLHGYDIGSVLRSLQFDREDVT